jgi:type IV pilus assembly protein PilA
MLSTLKTNIQKGFTLIELMIVIAIIGILAAIAIPQYQSFTRLAQINDAVSLMQPAINLFKLAEADSTCPSNNPTPTYNLQLPADISGKYVESVTYNGTFVTTVPATGTTISRGCGVTALFRNVAPVDAQLRGLALTKVYLATQGASRTNCIKPTGSAWANPTGLGITATTLSAANTPTVCE